MTNIEFFSSLSNESVQAATPQNETARLLALESYGILDTPREQFYDDITQLAAYIFKTPIALISFIDGTRQWYKSRVGVVAGEISRQFSFCAHAILQPYDAMVVRDPLNDPRFLNNPLVIGKPSILFYAGMPIVTSTGEALGTLCVIDTKPHDTANEHELAALRNLARQVMAHLDIGKSLAELQDCQTQLNQINQQLAEESVTDELTQLKNRRGFNLSLQLEWERTFRHSNSLSLLLLNIDQFSRYRDEFGSTACDDVLRKIAELISHGARKLDLIARFCNDEFAILLPETDSQGVLQLAERIRNRVELEHWPNRPITVSIGVSCYNGLQIDADALLTDAHQSLSQAKQAGCNRIISGQGIEI